MRTVYLSLVVIVLVLLPLLTFANDAFTRDSKSAKRYAVKPLLIWLLVALVCYQLGLSAIWAFIESIGREREISLEQMGFMLAVILPVSMVGSILASILDVRLGRFTPVLLATVAGAIGLLILVNTASVTALAAGFFAPSNCVEFRYRFRLWRHSAGERSKRFRDTGSWQPIAWHCTRTYSGRHTGKQRQTRSGYLGVDPRNDRWVIDFVPNARSSLSAELSECIGAFVRHLLYFNDVTKRVSSIGHQVPVTLHQ
jgi:hypothetical protein